VALSNYSELTAAIEGWMHRSDLAAKIPDFIWLAEARLGRKLALLDWEEQVDLATVGNVVTLPADYKQMRAVNYNGKPLRYVTPSQYAEEVNPNLSVATPYLYTILGSSSLQVGPAVPDDTEIELQYIARLEHLSTGNPVNWLLTNHPDLMLFGSLEAATSYTKDKENEAKWAGKFAGGIEELDVENAFSQPGGTPLVIRSA
jgi:hypothetical protein